MGSAGLGKGNVPVGEPGYGQNLLRREKVPWHAALPHHGQLSRSPEGLKVLDATGQPLAYVYARENEANAQAAKVLTIDQARRIAATIAKTADLLTPPGS